MAKSGSDGKVSNTLVAAGCAAVLAVYAAGYSRTNDAAQQLEEQSAARRPGSRERATTATSADIVAPSAGSAAEVANQPSREVARPETTREASVASTAPLAQAKVSAPAATPAPATEVAANIAPSATPAPAPTPIAPAPTPTPAPAAPATPAPAPAKAAPKWKDGTWYGWGTSRHGDIQAEVVIKDGKIVKSGIAQCLTRYSCDVIDVLINQPVLRQSADVDYVSRATQSSDAYYYALLEALDASTK